MDKDTRNTSTVNTTMLWKSNVEDELADYIFDRKDVRAVFLVLYSIVFCSCFFGNLMVILVTTLHWRMRSITNFCLANLAFADLCVGVFCVYQNIVTYLIESWVFGEIMCKMYHFINSLSTTASVLILVVISFERYLVIIYPMTCKQVLTPIRLRIAIGFVWILSAAISSPRFYYFSTVNMPLPDNQHEILCLPDRTKYNSRMIDMISMTLLYLIPLTIITILYTHIGIVLWKSSSNNQLDKFTSTASIDSGPLSDSSRKPVDQGKIEGPNLTLPSPYTHLNLEQQGQQNVQTIVLVKFENNKDQQPIKENNEKNQCTIFIKKVPNDSQSFSKKASKVHNQGNSTLEDNQLDVENSETISKLSNCLDGSIPNHPSSSQAANSSANKSATCKHFPKPSSLAAANNYNNFTSAPTGAPTTLEQVDRRKAIQTNRFGLNALRSRRKLVNMMIIVVLAFAICHLPFHARKIWQYWSPAWAPYQAGTVFSTLFTPITFLIMYANSAINPILYAFMSQKFQTSFIDLLRCKLRRRPGL